MKPRQSAVLIASVLSLALMPWATHAEVVTRSCTYLLSVGSAAENLGPYPIPNGRLTATSRVRNNSWHDARGVARENSAVAAKYCLQNARQEGITEPTECFDSRRTLATEGRALISGMSVSPATLNYELRSALPATARSELCRRAAGQDARRISSYEVTLTIPSGSRDVRRECAIDGMNPVVLRGNNLNCDRGTSAARPETRWSRWYTDKSPAQMPNFIASYCRNDRNSQLSEILQWQMRQGDGAYRVRFSCR